MSSTVVKKAVKVPKGPNGLEFQNLPERKAAEYYAVEILCGFDLHDGDHAPLSRHLVHGNELESVFGSLGLFDFQVPDLVEPEPALNVPPHLHIEDHAFPSFPNVNYRR